VRDTNGKVVGAGHVDCWWVCCCDEGFGLSTFGFCERKMRQRSRLD
jgi:hypothetical protein